MDAQWRRTRPGTWLQGFPWGAATTQGLPNRLLVCPCDAPLPIDAVAVYVSAAGAGVTALVNVYNSDSDGFPTTLAHSEAIDCSTTGFKTVVLPSVLPAGIYWIGPILLAAGASFSITSASNYSCPHAPGYTATPYSLNAAGWQLTGLSVAPDPFPVPSASGSGSQPLSWMRMAA
jgi:hypothetical protein